MARFLVSLGLVLLSFANVAMVVGGTKSPPGQPPAKSPAPSPAPSSDEFSPPPKGSQSPPPPPNASPPPTEPPTSPPEVSPTTSPSNPPPPPPPSNPPPPPPTTPPPPPPPNASPPPTEPPTSPPEISPTTSPSNPPPPPPPSNPPPPPPTTPPPPPSSPSPPPTNTTSPPPTNATAPPPTSTTAPPPPCDNVGSVCHDPRFVGGDGVLFYFHGKKDSTFCIFTDDDLHINAYFIGKFGGASRKRDFTWVKSLGIMFGEHQLYIGANKVAIWDDSVEQISIVWNNVPIALSTKAGASWIEPRAGIQIKRNKDVNSISVLIEGLLALDARVVPITATESRIHNYDIPEDDCFAHLDLNFKFFHISDSVHGVLGQTYAPNFINPVDRTLAMPIMGGDALYMTSSLMAPDCKVTKFGSIGQVVRRGSDFPVVQCSGQMGGGSGIVCRR